MEILTIIGVQKCQFSAKSEILSNAYAYCSRKLIVNNECLAYIHSLDFPLIIHILTKNCMIPYFIILNSDRANFAVRGHAPFQN